MVRRIYIEGNIGSGKSTFCTCLNDRVKALGLASGDFSVAKTAEMEKSPSTTSTAVAATATATATNKVQTSDKRMIVIQEPVDEWIKLCDENGKNILDLYYGDCPQYAFLFQLTTFITRVSKIKNAERVQGVDLILSERSNYTDKHIFMKMCIENGWLTTLEKTLYNRWFETIVDEDLDGDFFIYLRTDHNKCHQRIQKRGRVEEKGVPLELLKNLEEKHDMWLLDEKMKDHCIVVDNTEERTYDDYVKIVDKLLERIIDL